jgi:hypothetical protein
LVEELLHSSFDSHTSISRQSLVVLHNFVEKALRISS